MVVKSFETCHKVCYYLDSVTVFPIKRPCLEGKAKEQSWLKVGRITCKRELKYRTGNSLVVQCLGLRAFTAVGPRVQSLVRELRYRKLRGTVKK